MDALVILLLIVLIVLTFSRFSKLFLQISKLEADIRQLKATLPGTASPLREPEKQPTPAPAAPPAPYKSIFTVVEEDMVANDAAPSIAATRVPGDTVNKNPEKITTPQWGINKESNALPPRVQRPGFFERNPDLEKFIGENLVSKIGIAILVLAIGFFVKYAIEQNWIGPAGRVAIGICCGAILILIAHRLRQHYVNFSSVLAGGGLAVFYFTITLAFHQFQLFSQSAAFIILVCITCFAVAIALLYNKQELAVISMVGGFASPFLVSNGSGNYHVLFVYLILLNSGLLFMAFHKTWRVLNVLCFIFTVIIFGTWLQLLPTTEIATTYKNAFAYATVFYLLFFIINIANNIKHKRLFVATDFGILLANTCLFFATGIYCLVQLKAPEYKGVFSAVMGVFNLAATYFLFRKMKVDKNIVYLLIGITLSFISLTAPLQLHGNYITIFWATESVLLYWLFTKSRLQIIQYASLIVWFLMLFSLVIDWYQVYNKLNGVNIIFNKGLVTAIYAAICTYVYYQLAGQQQKNTAVARSVLWPFTKRFRVVAILLLFIGGAFEINYQFDFYYPVLSLDVVYLLLYLLLFTCCLAGLHRIFIKIKLSALTYILLYSLCVVVFFLYYPQVYIVQEWMLVNREYAGHFSAHWIAAVLLAVILYLLIQELRKQHTILPAIFTQLSWLLCAIIVVFLSVEVHLLLNTFFYNATTSLYEIQSTYIKVGLPVLWGLCSFAFMWLGMKHKYKPLRIISLTLFTVLLVKLLVFDIRNITAAGKIAAFFILGVILLTVSFMYQRLKRILIDNEEVL